MDISNLLINIAQAATEAVIEGAPVASETAAEHAADPGLLGTLGINWKLFVAQLINFAVILFIFWRWVVKPLGKALTERQKKIEQSLKTAEAMEQEKINLEKTKIEEMRKARNEAEEIIKSATTAAEQMKNKIVGEAHDQAAKLAEQTRAQLQAEKDKMIKEAKAELAEVVVTASEKILRAKLDPKKDRQLIDESLRRIEA